MQRCYNCNNELAHYCNYWGQTLEIAEGLLVYWRRELYSLWAVLNWPGKIQSSQEVEDLWFTNKTRFISNYTMLSTSSWTFLNWLKSNYSEKFVARGFKKGITYSLHYLIYTPSTTAPTATPTTTWTIATAHSGTFIANSNSHYGGWKNPPRASSGFEIKFKRINR